MASANSKEFKAAMDNMGAKKNSVQDEDTISFVASFQQLLKGDPDYDNLYANPLTLFSECVDGVLLAKAINAVKEETITGKIEKKIDLETLNQVGSKSIHLVNANLNLVLGGVKKLGIKLVNCGTNDIIEKNKTIVLGLIWQIVRAGLIQDVSLLSHPELIRLLLPGEQLTALIKLEAEELLMRWANHHLMRAGDNRRVTNFTSDLKDSEIYSILLQRIAPRKIDTEKLNEAMASGDHLVRATGIIDQCGIIGTETFVRPLNIANGHRNFNMALVAALFNSHIGIHLPTEDDLDAMFAKLEGNAEQIEQLQKSLESAIARQKELDADKVALNATIQDLETKVAAEQENHEHVLADQKANAENEKQSLENQHQRDMEEAEKREEALKQALEAETAAKEAERAAKEAEILAKHDTAEAGEAAKAAALALRNAEEQAKEAERAAKEAVTTQLHETQAVLKATEDKLVEALNVGAEEKSAKEAETKAKEAVQKELEDTKSQLKERTTSDSTKKEELTKLDNEVETMSKLISQGLTGVEIPSEGTNTEKLLKLIDQLLKANKENDRKKHEALTAYAQEKQEKELIIEKVSEQHMASFERRQQLAAELKAKSEKKGFFNFGKGKIN